MGLADFHLWLLREAAVSYIANGRLTVKGWVRLNRRQWAGARTPLRRFACTCTHTDSTFVCTKMVKKSIKATSFACKRGLHIHISSFSSSPFFFTSCLHFSLFLPTWQKFVSNYFMLPSLFLWMRLNGIHTSPIWAMCSPSTKCFAKRDRAWPPLTTTVG
jgi:hypothetical protein